MCNLCANDCPMDVCVCGCYNTGLVCSAGIGLGDALGEAWGLMGASLGGLWLLG